MTTIRAAQASLIDLEVETVRTDAMQSFTKQETIVVDIETDEGLSGTGYSYTIGTGGRSVIALLRDTILPAIVGQDSRNIEALWQRSYNTTRATAIGPITCLALAAVDTALWDLRCLRAKQPLWRMAGGYRNAVPLYDTENGWLHLATDELIAGAVSARDNKWGGTKIKVGKRSGVEDVARLHAVREAVGPDFDIMIDANQAFTSAEALRRAAAFATLDIFWFEEPLPADDVSGHARLAQSTSIPIAVGESMYSIGQFRDYLQRDGASIIQPDVSRVGGITPWLKIAHMAEAFNAIVCPHFLMELHVSLVAAVPNGRYVEHIPQLRAITSNEIELSTGHALAPDAPGLGIAWNRDAIDDRRVV